jgi:hypothetical protein
MGLSTPRLLLLGGVGIAHSEWMAGVPSQAGARFLSATQRSDRLRGQPTLVYSGYRGLFPVVKRPVFEADHSPLSSAEVKSRGAITPLPLMSSWHGVCKISCAVTYISF